ncbi:MAG: 4Fe-4S dicluster domain-containing protein [Promethearchaeota archaeon]|nr:MAG: 4Fe-4S dicluster domain-containing protein [Candidatus Lokiarchaeota archaeon]
MLKMKKSPIKSREEVKFLSMSRKYPDQFLLAETQSKQEGFEYLYSGMSKKEIISRISTMLGLRSDLGFFGKLKMVKTMVRNFIRIFKGRKEGFKDIHSYYQELKKSGTLTSSKVSNLIDSYPNKSLWEQLSAYAKHKWKVHIGFTKLPPKLIFKDKAVLFKHVLICIQEMNKEKIKQAPKIAAGGEVIKTYGTLGLAVNDIARWLRSKGIKSHANHPLGGLVNTPPLAGKAGMGWRGKHGLLITPEFGPRHRIAPIFIEKKIFKYTDTQEHRWIEQWCETCGKCQRACPTQAIQSNAKVSIEGIPAIGRTKTCIDREKCFPYFNKTLGCSVCIKVCPFSKGIDAYIRLKNIVKARDS